jgi:hypothetical protein
MSKIIIPKKTDDSKGEYKIKGRPDTIFRVEKNPDNPYVTIDVRPILNPKLSFKAKGILTYFMSRPNGWEINMVDLVNRSKDGTASIRAGLKELKKAGHMEYVKERDQKQRITGWLIKVYEVSTLNPSPDSENRIVATEPDSENLKVENLKVENRTQVLLSTLSINELKNEEEEVAPNKLKSSLLLSKITKLFDPIDYGTITIKPEFRKLPASIVLGHIAKAYHDRKGLSQPIGYLTSLLNKNEQPDPFYMAEFRRVLPADYLEAVGMGEYICAECEKVFKTAAKLEQHTNYMHPEPEPFEVKPLENSEVSKTWQSILAQLQMEMPRASFDTWVRDTMPVSFGDGVLTVSTQNAYARDWLENRLASTINRLLVGIMNTDVIQVQFVAVSA